MRLYLVLGREVRVGLDHLVRVRARARGMDRARDRARAIVRGLTEA